MAGVKRGMVDDDDNDDIAIGGVGARKAVRLDIAPTLDEVDLDIDADALSRALGTVDSLVGAASTAPAPAPASRDSAPVAGPPAPASRGVRIGGAGHGDGDYGDYDDYGVGGVGDGGPLPRPHVEFPGIRRRFDEDPVGAVRRAVEPFHAHRLDGYDDQIARIAAWTRDNEARNDEIWDNPETQYLALVSGFLRGEQTTTRRGAIRPNAGSGSGAAVGPGPSPGVAAGLASMGGAAGGMGSVDARPVFAATPAAVRAAAAASASAAAGADASAVLAAAARRSDADRTLNNVRAAAASAQVSGTMQLKNEIFAASEWALQLLAMENHDKFGNAVRAHFYKDRSAMRLFARLTAVVRQLVNLENPQEPQFNMSEARRTANISKIAADMNEFLVYDEFDKQAYVSATSHQRRRAREDVYDILTGRR